MRFQYNGRLLLGLVLTLFGVACSGGGTRSLGGGGRFCSLNQTAGFELPSTAEKVSLKPEDGALPAGDYIYRRADMLYVYKPDPNNADTWVIIQTIEDSPGEIANAVQVPYCVRGLTPSTPEFSAQAQGINTLNVQPDGKTTFTVRDYGFRWNRNTLLLEIDAEASEEEFQSPEKVYEGKATEFNFFKVNASNPSDVRYDLLSREEYPELNLTIYLRVQMVRNDLPTPEEEGTEEDTPPVEEAP